MVSSLGAMRPLALPHSPPNPNLRWFQQSGCLEIPVPPTLSPQPQMVSLLHLADITEEGVTFQSPTDGRGMLLTPEHSIQVGAQLAPCGVGVFD